MTSARPDTIRLIVRIRDQHPDLTPSGFAIDHPRRRPKSYDEWLARKREHSAARARMNSDWFAAEVEAAIGFLQSADAPKTLRRHLTSYGLKHSVENLVGRYISNGALLVAALALEMDVKRIPETQNARIRFPRRRVA